MAKVGGGEVEYILLNSPSEEVARKFYKRIAEPVLTDITLKAEGVSLEEVFPAEVATCHSAACRKGSTMSLPFEQVRE